MINLARGAFGVPVAAALLLSAPVALAVPADLTMGHQRFLDIGLQFAAWSDVGDPATTSFDLSRWNESNFTTLGFADRVHAGSSHMPTGLPLDNSLPWSRLLGFVPGATIILEPFELPFLPSLTRLVIGDEQLLNSQINLDTIKAQVEAIHNNYPGVIAHTAQAGTQVANMATGQINPEMRTMMSYTQPDMLAVNQYPYIDPATLPGGSPTWMYTVFERVRELGLEGNDGTGNNPIPTGLYSQSFVGDGGVNSTWYRPPSESEIYQQHFAAWAFGFKLTNPWVYDNLKNNVHVNSVMFTGDNTDNPTPTFYDYAEVARLSRNLSPALTRLISTDARMIMGEHDAGGTVPNTTPQAVSTWDAAADPYITSITATNLGAKNNGLRGDVIVGYLEPLDAAFTDPGFANDTYFMLVNALSDFEGLATQTQQSVHVEFNFGASGITGLPKLNRDTGLVEDVPLTPLGGSLYSLDLVLGGGLGDLFKFDNGATFVSRVGGKWSADADGDWTVVGNWQSGNVPNGTGVPITFGDVLTAPRLVTIDASRKVGSIVFDGAHGYTVRDPSSLLALTLEAPSGPASLAVMQGAHLIDAKIEAASDLDVDVAAGAALALSSLLPLNMNGNNLIKTGSGTLTLGDVGGGGGNVFIADGVLRVNGTHSAGGFYSVLAGGELGGSGILLVSGVINSGTLAPGNSTGSMIVSGDVTQGASAVLEMEIGGTADHDKLTVGGTLTADGTLRAILTGGFVPQAGDQFDLLGLLGPVSGSFDVLDLPSLTGGLTWDGSALLTTGILEVIAGGLLLGDANNDGAVTADDLIAVQQNFGNVGPNGDGTDLGDANDDGAVTADDLVAVQQNFGNALGAASAVPEPGAAAVLLLSGLVGRMRRRG